MESKPISLVYNCDCVEYMRGLSDDYFNLAIADPPYSHGNSDTFIKNGRFHKGRFNRYRQVDGVAIDIDEWDKTPADEFFEQLFRVSQNQIIWGANYFDGMPATRCFVVWKKQIPENFSMAMCEYAWTSFQGNAKVVEFSQLSKKGDPRFHPTQKPVKLIEYLITTYTNKGDIVLDNCIGSGTTAVAACNIGRHFIGFEKDEMYFRLAEKRIKENNRQLKLF